jgi:SAM-dependent methyltransferase
MVKSLAWDWNKVDASYWTAPAEEVYYLLHRWKDLHFSSVLDLGCGIGRHSMLFARNGFSVTALDLSESGLKRLSETAKSLKLSINTVLADVKSLPFENGSFDALLAYHSIYHVDSPGMERAISEVHRVLKPKGEAFLTFTSKSTFSYTDPECREIDDHVRMKKEEDGSVLPHYFCDREDVYRLLAGFTIIKLRHVEDISDGKSSWHYFAHVKAV